MLENLNPDPRQKGAAAASGDSAPMLPKNSADESGSDLHDEDAAFDAENESGAADLEDWKDQLRQDFEQWLSSVDEIPEADGEEEEIRETPDLYSFYAQLAAASSETRKANRRTAEAFSQWGETLAKFDGDLRLLREQLSRQPAAKEESLPRAWCLALIELADRLGRVGAAFAEPPPKIWWGGDTQWRHAWETQRQGFGILLSHMEALLGKAGISRIAALHKPFDPETMSAVAAEPNSNYPHQTVLEEVAPGYRLHGETLRVAQVKVSTNKPSIS